jgi:serine/threonine protein kinase
MGQVFLGETPGRRKVAVKLIRSEYAEDPDFRLRFAREVAAARQVGGFHTALVIDANPDDDPPWMATVYIAGPSLSAAVAEHGPLEPDAIRDLGAALAEGLSAIHACGLVHRDFKPSNIILGEDGPRIIDFGIAKSVTATTITPDGVHIGTLQYMSPEHLGAGEITAASDVFSLGSVLAFAATGHAPFDAADDVAIMGRILTQDPVVGPLEGPLRDIIRACLDKNPAERPTLGALLAFFAGADSVLIPRPVMVQRSGAPEDAASQPQRKQPITVTLDPAEELAIGTSAAAPPPGIQGSRFPPGSGAAQDASGGNRPRISVRDLPSDVRRRFWRIRAVIMVIAFAVAATLTRSWEIAWTLAVLAGIADAI